MNKELQNLAKYTNYLEEKLMSALGPKSEFSDNLKANFRKILRENYCKDGDTWMIHNDFINYYKNGGNQWIKK